MRSVRELRGVHKGRPAVVLGAGPSLPEQLKDMPEGAILISINERPPLLVDCDFIVFFDFNTGPLIENFSGARISPFKNFSDYWLGNDVWFNGFSGSMAIYLACYMGCDPVILMGMDCYQGDKEYFTDKEPGSWKSTGCHSTLAEHLHAWRQAFKNCPNPQVIRAAGGPLVEVFGKWEPKLEDREKDLIGRMVTR